MTTNHSRYLLRGLALMIFNFSPIFSPFLSSHITCTLLRACSGMTKSSRLFPFLHFPCFSLQLNIEISCLLLSALAASGGQLPLSSLEGGSKVMLGASGGQGGGLPSSLFLNHPALLHMGQNPGAGLISAAVAKASQSSPFPSASSISPTLCSPSPCSSPASSCSSSEMAHSPPSLGGAKIE